MGRSQADRHRPKTTLLQGGESETNGSTQRKHPSWENVAGLAGWREEVSTMHFRVLHPARAAPCSAPHPAAGQRARWATSPTHTCFEASLPRRPPRQEGCDPSCRLQAPHFSPPTATTVSVVTLGLPFLRPQVSFTGE